MTETKRKGPAPGFVHAHGLRGKLLEYFRRMPDEWLTVDDVVSKFRVCRQRVYDTTFVMRKHGELAPDGPIRRPETAL